MTGALAHLGQLAAYAGRRRAHDRRDAAVLADLTVSSEGLGLPPTVEVRWLGVAGYLLSCQGTTIAIDPYVRRVTLGDMVRRRVVASDPALLDAWVPRVDAVLLGHTHFDHALDTPALARRDQATVYGGRSAAHLMGIHGLAHLAQEVDPHRTFSVGPFDITFVPSVHAKLFLGRSVPNGGEITCEHVGDLCPQAYECGQVWGIHIAVDGATIYHQGSADLLDEEVRHRDVDVFLCGVAGRQFTPDYLPRILRRLQPATLVVGHHDDFFTPLGSDLGFAFGVDVAKVPEEVASVTRDLRVVTLPAPTPIAGITGSNLT